jgi:NTP pyrophosphatase (non-canonical NTP hydrolase)
MFTKKSKKELRDTWAYGLESCHNCDDESCDDNLNRIESATTIHASQPPKVEGSEELPPPAADMPVSLRELQRLAHENAIKKGWHETPISDGEMIALMHSELSEALEELRNGNTPTRVYFNGQKPEGVPIELADVVIRIMDFCGLHGIDLQTAVVTKMVYNQTRPHRHGGKKL